VWPDISDVLGKGWCIAGFIIFIPFNKNKKAAEWQPFYF
jgi:hypothetical protein